MLSLTWIFSQGKSVFIFAANERYNWRLQVDTVFISLIDTFYRREKYNILFKYINIMCVAAYMRYFPFGSSDLMFSEWISCVFLKLWCYFPCWSIMFLLYHVARFKAWILLNWILKSFLYTPSRDTLLIYLQKYQ